MDIKPDDLARLQQIANNYNRSYNSPYFRQVTPENFGSIAERIANFRKMGYIPDDERGYNPYNYLNNY